MDIYKYSIELSYIRQKERVSETIMPESIRSMVIDRDYANTNMPVIFMNVTLRRALIDDMIKNVTKNTMVLSIYKYIYREDKYNTKTRYIHQEMMYFLDNDLSYKDTQDSDEENTRRADLTRNINIGLMALNTINNNKQTTNTVLRNTTMMNAVCHCIPSKLNMIIERFHYNDSINELLIKPQSSVAKTIQYLNSIKVFYKTPYRFFIDFDCGYLLSTSGTNVPKKGESINTVIISIKDPIDEEGMMSGMTTNHKTKNYQINVSAIDTELVKNTTTEKMYTSISGISEDGQTKSQSLSINKNKQSIDKTEIIRTPSSNPNLIKNISASTNQSSSHMFLNKIDVDVSVFTPNKRYIINNYDGHKDRNGDFILTRKRELYYRETDDKFNANTMLEFDQVIK